MRTVARTIAAISDENAGRRLCTQGLQRAAERAQQYPTRWGLWGDGCRAMARSRPPPLPPLPSSSPFLSLSRPLSHQGRTSGEKQEKPKGTKVQAAQDTRAPARACLLRIIN